MACSFFSIKAERPLFLSRLKNLAELGLLEAQFAKADALLITVDVSVQGAAEQFLKQRGQVNDQPLLPVLEYAKAPSAPLPASELAKRSVLEQFAKTARLLAENGINDVVISMDADGLLQKMLSPRFLSGDLESRAQLPLQIFQSLTSIFEQTCVALTVEELCPGGMDATDGLWMATKLCEMGLSTLIISSGTEDFPLLKYRRETCPKTQEQKEHWHSTEPWMSSAIWCEQLPNVKRLAQGSVTDLPTAQGLAQAMGLSGLVHDVASRP